MSSKNSETPLKDRIDWITVIVPFLAILALCVCFILMPDASKSVLDTIRFILGDTFGLFYLAVGLFVFLLSLFLAFSRFGNIRLGKPETGRAGRRRGRLPGRTGRRCRLG